MTTTSRQEGKQHMVEPVSSTASASALGEGRTMLSPEVFPSPSELLPHLPPSTDLPMSESPESDHGDDSQFAAADDAPEPPASGAGTVTGVTNGGISKSSASRPQSSNYTRALNPRSCVTCRKRKVKCDKLHPCSNCTRAHIECVFPSPGRAPRKSRKTGDGPNKDLLERLRRLESVVKDLGADIPPELAREFENKQEQRGDGDGDQQRDTTDAPGDTTHSVVVVEDEGSAEHGAINQQRPAGSSAPSIQAGEISSAEQEHRRKAQWVEHHALSHFEHRFGRLVVNEGKTRYVNNSFWANLSNEVEDLKGILNQSSDDEDPLETSPGALNHLPSDHHGFIFGFSSLSIDLLKLHPQPGQIRLYWHVFKDRVDPLVKLLHIPTLEPSVLKAASHLSSLSRCFECLLFAIYYGATTSLSSEDCVREFGEEKTVLLSRYQFAIEQSLARASFLVSEETVLLQAFVLFLICLRRNSDARVIWTITGLVVRIAQTLGVHRDGSHFRLPPFEVEMRRRLWWQVCLLDIRASEDHGCDPTIVEQSFDTKMPLNINDADMDPGMKEFPLERQGCTDMSFCLLRFEVANTFRRLNYVPPGPGALGNPGDPPTTITLEDKERWIRECQFRLDSRFLKHCDMTVPLFWVTATVARLMLSKMWLMVYHPFQRLESGPTALTPEVKDKLFLTSLENMEYSLLLETESRTMKWGWLFRTYMQWHALAFLLSELCHRTTGELVERAWTAVEKTRDGRWGSHYTNGTNTGHLWRPLKKLYRKAKDARRRGLQEEHLLKQQRADTMPHPSRTYSPNANPMFGRPNKPTMIRAPLSQAQLQRFAEGPEYGRTPISSEELLPKLGSRSVSDTAPANAATQPTGHRQSSGNDVSSGKQQPSMAGFGKMPPHVGKCPTAGLNADYLSSGNMRENIDYSDLDLDLLASGKSFNVDDDVAPPGRANSLPVSMPPELRREDLAAFTRLTHAGSPNTSGRAAGLYNPFDTTTQDSAAAMASASSSSASPPFLDTLANMTTSPHPLDPTSMSDTMETTPDFNWENWDCLVRQFGMDLDSGGPPEDGAARPPFAFSSSTVGNGGFVDTFDAAANPPAGAGSAVGDAAAGEGSVSAVANAWGGPNWEMGTPFSAQNLRMGMGMGGGDWF